MKLNKMEDPWISSVRNYLSGKFRVTLIEVIQAVSGVSSVEQSRDYQTAIGKIIIDLGWIKVDAGKNKHPRRWYENPNFTRNTCGVFPVKKIRFIEDTRCQGKSLALSENISRISREIPLVHILNSVE